MAYLRRAALWLNCSVLALVPGYDAEKHAPTVAHWADVARYAQLKAQRPANPVTS